MPNNPRTDASSNDRSMQNSSEQNSKTFYPSRYWYSVVKEARFKSLLPFFSNTTRSIKKCLKSLKVSSGSGINSKILQTDSLLRYALSYEIITNPFKEKSIQSFSFENIKFVQIDLISS